MSEELSKKIAGLRYFILDYVKIAIEYDWDKKDTKSFKSMVKAEIAWLQSKISECNDPLFNDWVSSFKVWAADILREEDENMSG